MEIFDNIGNTPTYKIEDEKNEIYLKYEGANSFGSSKDRSAIYVLNKLYKEGKINKDTTIIESSSGNMGIALAATCKHLDNKFICVIDPHISAVNEFLIKSYGAETIKVTEDPIVSSDIIGSDVGALVDLLLTDVLEADGNLVKVIAWYDNEMGYSHQMVRTALKLGEFIK